MKFACDTGGTFTDLTVEDQGVIRMYKSATTPADPIEGVLNAFIIAAEDNGASLHDFLALGEVFVHGTTHSINAIITGNTAKTGLLVTEGHPDILLIREGGRAAPFDHEIRYPDPYIPRTLTFEISGRMNFAGEETEAFDEVKARESISAMAEKNVEAVAVSLLWSVVNPAHEIKVGQMLEELLPSIPYTLSHQLNPALREYRRTSSAAIDASLKPLMQHYLSSLRTRLSGAGFDGRVLMLTGLGGVVDAEDMESTPIHSINSGPSMAPIAGRHYGSAEGEETLIVADTGGTTYDVSLVRNGEIPMTRETWIGRPYSGDMTGFPSVDVKGVGAGGGSIAWLDNGGLLHVGPQSAGAVPGPACYGAGGEHPTFTDCCLALGYIDPDFFLGGQRTLDAAASKKAILKYVAEPLGVSIEEAAVSTIEVITENMVQAVTDITVNQGIDPAKAALIGGGGAAGLNSIWIARRLGCKKLIVPETGATLSAAGALMSDLRAEFHETNFMTSRQFDHTSFGKTLERLREKSVHFVGRASGDNVEHDIDFFVEARYGHQVWEIEIPVSACLDQDQVTLDALTEVFHRNHEEKFAYRDPDSPIEFLTWTAKVSSKFASEKVPRLPVVPSTGATTGERRVYLPGGTGWTTAKIHQWSGLRVGKTYPGPAIVESPFTTVVIDTDATFDLSSEGSLVIYP